MNFVYARVVLQHVRHASRAKKLSHMMLISLYYIHYYSNTIVPKISLHMAKIMYNWNILLASGSLQIKVDPMLVIQVTWTDWAMNGNG